MLNERAYAQHSMIHPPFCASVLRWGMAAFLIAEILCNAGSIWVSLCAWVSESGSFLIVINIFVVVCKTGTLLVCILFV